MTLAFSAVTATLSVNAPSLSPWVFLIGAYGFLFATHALARSPWGLLTTFGFTGFIGYGVGPLLGYLMSSQNGSEIVTTALGGTAFIFFGLSGWVLASRKDFHSFGVLSRQAVLFACCHRNQSFLANACTAAGHVSRLHVFLKCNHPVPNQ